VLVDLPVKHRRQQIEGAALPKIHRKRFEDLGAVHADTVELAVKQKVTAGLCQLMFKLNPVSKHFFS